jgi:Trypsin-like peptidase domain
MAARFEDRFAEVFSCRTPGSKQDGSYGTGYLLGNGVVLTARHVIVPEGWNEIPPELDVSARSINAIINKEAWGAADLLWPPREELANNGPDVALLQLRNIPAGMEAGPLLGLEPPEDAEEQKDYELKVWAVGFPAFAKIAGQSRVDTHQIFAMTRPHSGRVSQTFEIHQWEFGKTKTGEKATEEFDWAGFSGAALFNGRRLIGVVVTANVGGRFDFRAIRINPLLARKEFSTALQGAATITTDAARAEVPPIERLVCLLDRDDQEKGFIAAHKRCCPAPQANEPAQPLRPLVCLLPGAGEYRHVPEDMAERLSLKTLPKDLGWSSDALSFQWLDWPPTHLGADDAVAQLRESLWNALCGANDAPSDPAEFRKLWKDGSRPRLFRSDVTQVELTHAAADVLAAWSKFWVELTPPDRRVPAHLLLLGPKFAEAQAWRAMASTPANVTIEPLAELDQCNPIHLRRWLEERLPIHAGQHKRILERLDTMLSEEFPGRFYLKDLKLRVRKLVQEGSHA